ncbi:MAG: hypothetical protein NW237_03600 [Cyanobacteriota bacterium]|nr:hypothetical protein [Cyanobacteriota bacterium]
MVDFLVAQAEWGSLDLEIDQREKLREAERELWEMEEWGSLPFDWPF